MLLPAAALSWLQTLEGILELKQLPASALNLASPVASGNLRDASTPLGVARKAPGCSQDLMKTADANLVCKNTIYTDS